MSRFDGLFDAAKQQDADDKNAIDIQTSKHPDIQFSKSKDPEYQRTTVYLPKELHRRFKSVAALRGKDMSDVISELVSNWLSEQNI